MAADAERKFEEVARKMNMMENELVKAMNRADISEEKIVEREHELKVIGDNMKAMEVSSTFILTSHLITNSVICCKNYIML